MDSAARKPFLYIPVETKVREFQAKLLLGCYAADAGFQVIIGEQVELLRKAKSMPPGIYIDKGIPVTKLRSVKWLRQCGHRVVGWCEEGLVMFSREAYSRDRVSVPVLSRIDLFFAWGAEQADAICMAAPNSRNKIILAGNPRFDLLRHPFRNVFSDEVKALRDAHGRFVLINTNFGIYNNFMGPDYFIKKLMEGHGRFQNDQHKRFFLGLAEYVRQNFDCFGRMIKRMSETFPQRQIIVRPHPSENHEAWREKLSGLANVKVIHYGNVIPWLIACDVLIHHSCTTSVEATVLGTPVVAYQPISRKEYEPELPSKVSLIVHDEEKLFNAIDKIIIHSDNNDESTHIGSKRNNAFDHYVESLEGQYACEKILDAISSMAETQNAPLQLKLSNRLSRLRLQMRDFGSIVKSKAEYLLNKHQSNVVYRKQKFPGLDLEEVEKGIRLFQNLSSRFTGVTSKELNGARTCFSIYKRS